MKGCVVWLEFRHKNKRVEIRSFDHKYEIDLLAPGKSDAVEDPLVFLARIKGEVENSPFYCEFIHRIESSSMTDYNSQYCHSYLAERKR